MRKKNSGYTLVEILVTMVVFLVALGTVLMVYTRGIKYYKRQSDSLWSFRIPAVVLDKISRELMCDADAVLYPLADDLSFGAGSIVFSTLKNPSEIIGYIFDAQSETITRVIYASDFDPYNLETNKILPGEGNPKIIANGIENIKYQLLPVENNLLQISMIAKGDNKDYYFQTSVCLKK